jgi:hypothetical protein
MTDCDWLCVHLGPAPNGYSERTSSLRDRMTPQEESAEQECSLHHWKHGEDAERAMRLWHWTEQPDADVEMADLKAVRTICQPFPRRCQVLQSSAADSSHALRPYPSPSSGVGYFAAAGGLKGVQCHKLANPGRKPKSNKKCDHCGNKGHSLSGALEECPRRTSMCKEASSMI